MNLLDVTLTIAPQTPGSPVPEPSALATLGAALGWAALRRARKRAGPRSVPCVSRGRGWLARIFHPEIGI